MSTYLNIKLRLKYLKPAKAVISKNRNCLVKYLSGSNSNLTSQSELHLDEVLMPPCQFCFIQSDI